MLQCAYLGEMNSWEHAYFEEGPTHTAETSTQSFQNHIVVSCTTMNLTPTVQILHMQEDTKEANYHSTVADKVTYKLTSILKAEKCSLLHIWRSVNKLV